MKRSLAVGVVLLLAACASRSGDGPATGDDDIVGGVDAKSRALDAVGALMLKNPQTQQMEELCSATLIGKNAVLSAKHCAVQFTAATQATPDAGPAPITETRFIDQYEMYFAIGFDSASARYVRLASVDMCTDYDGGAAGLGCDVSVYRTAEAITDVTPLKVAEAAPGDDLLNQRLTAIGYGAQNVPENKLGTRKAGTLTVHATHGAFLQSIYPTADAFSEAITKYEGVGFLSNNADALGQIYNQQLKPGYEMFVGGTGTDAQVCHGDSGGPLVQKIDGQLVVVGVASTVGLSGTKLPCNMGSVYATFGPKAQDLVKSSLAPDPCEGIPAAGRCEGDVAVRCTDPDEGPRRVVKNDCSAILQHCIAPAAAPDAGVADAGAADASDAGDAGDAAAPAASVVTCGD